MFKGDVWKGADGAFMIYLQRMQKKTESQPLTTSGLQLNRNA